MCVQAPEAAAVVGHPVAQLRPEAGQGSAGGESGPVFRLRLGKEPPLTVAEKGFALGLIVPPDAA